MLANQIALPRGSGEKLENFVSKGGTLIITGLTGYYDEDLRCAMMGGFEYEKLFGGLIREFKHIDASVEISVPDGNLSGNRWKGIIRPSNTAKVLCEKDGEVLALENKFGKGKVCGFRRCWRTAKKASPTGSAKRLRWTHQYRLRHTNRARK